ncbi:MAG: alanine--glyoxylate aminotransferase family protein [Gemmataceae bacterium]|nr:alanine--glyoxylate aminotransferase family protein [Gemmataceae bacterium]
MIRTAKPPKAALRAVHADWPRADAPRGTVCLLPGPVAIAPRVTAAFHEPLVYHRSEEFVPLFEGVRAKLSSLVGGKPVGMFIGSGTLANDAVAATLAADPARDNGLILTAGEFGDRLLRQANNWKLSPKVLTWNWGRAWQLDEVEAAMRVMPAGGWVWGAHHETSTGVLNDLPGLVRIARKYGHRVCVDCVSSLATVPVDLDGVYLATGASGKAIGSYAGVAFVFANPADLAHLETTRIPTYLDVAATVSTVGPRFTAPSPMIKALDVALDTLSTPERRAARYKQIAELGGYVRSRLRDAGYVPLAPDAVASPAIVTFAPPGEVSSAAFVSMCGAWGYQIAGQSGYLAERRLVQLAVMGHVTRADLEPLLDRLG